MPLMQILVEPRITIVSDGTGETAFQMSKAALVQFVDRKVILSRYKNVRSEKQIRAILKEAAEIKYLVVYTIVSRELRAYLQQQARELGVPHVDLLGPLLAGLAKYLGYEPRLVAGLLHDVNENYFRRISAMEYTVNHDDGKNLTGLEEADLVLLGISRTSKTPLSMYLSHHGWRVANIPLIRGFEVPPEILQLDPKKVVGLTIHPEVLATIRRARLQKLGQSRGGDYADLERVNDEIEYANEVFKKNKKWAVFNVTGKALEETASEIIKLMAARNLIPKHSLEGSPHVVPQIATPPPERKPEHAPSHKTSGRKKPTRPTRKSR